MLRELWLAGCASAAILAAAPMAAQEAAPAMVTAPPIEFTEWKLGNGLRVIAIPDPTTANVMTSMWYEVGSKNDPEGRSGFAHLFEHILSRKTENMPYNMINRLTEDVGGQRNASTGDDRTNYFEIVPAEYLETMLWTHAERMARPVVDDEVFERERSIVKEELRQRVLAPPYGIMQRFLLAENAYDVLPQRRPGIGSIEQLDSATLADARAFHQAYYGPDTATLIVAGNFDPAGLRALVERYFAAIPPRARPQSIEVAAREPGRTRPRSVAGTGPNVPLPAVGAIYQLPEAAHPDLPALTVLDMILSAGENSRLHKALVRTGKAVEVAEYLDSTQEGGFLAPFAIINPATDQGEVAGLIAAELERVRAEPVTEAELREAKNELFAAELSSRETASGRAFALGEALVTIGDPHAADRRLQQIAAVTVADVQRVAREWLKPESAVTFTYNQGSGEPATYANPAPMPAFATVPPPVGEPALLRDEAGREAPPPPIAAPQVARAEIVESRLANGIRLVSAQTGEVPLATMTVVLPGGTATDPAGKVGLAELAALVADKGTPTRSAEQIAAALESLGATMGASASPDGVIFSLTAPAANLAAAGAVMADVIRHADYPEDELERERARTIDSLKVALKDPGALATMIAPRLFYGAAPYGSVATVASLPQIGRADLVAWREARWHPATAQIVVSGGIAPAEAARIAEALFGQWRSAAPAPRPVEHPAGQAPAPRTIVIDMPEAGQAAVLAGVRVGPRASPDYYPLLLANSVLGVGSNGRLFEEVRTKRGLSYGAYSSFPSRADEAVLAATAQTKNESADEVAQVILDQFAALASQPAAADALHKRRLYLGGSVTRQLETGSGFNTLVAGLLLQGLEPGEAARYAERLAEVSPEAAAEVARRYVSPAQASLIVVGDAAQFLDDLRRIRPDVTVIPAAELDLSSGGLGG
ncbi:MAG TPA: pitrilysin family protein [Croceibacterium sp.]|nr:pitrilysin family protein [Croceibacterium sp.]